MNYSLNKFFNQFYLLLVLTIMYTPNLNADDMRQVQIKAREARVSLMQKADTEKAAAEKEATRSRDQILADRTSLKKAIADIAFRVQRLKKEVFDLTTENSSQEAKEQALNDTLAQTGGTIKELVGAIRVNAKDIDTLIRQNPQSALEGAPTAFLQDVSSDSQFPGMDDVRGIVDAVLNQITSSGEVELRTGPVIDRAGREVDADLLLLGPFTAAYRTEGETGFCSFSHAGGKLYALSRLPSNRMQKQINRYMEGRSEAVPMDISRGG